MKSDDAKLHPLRTRSGLEPALRVRIDTLAVPGSLASGSRRVGDTLQSALASGLASAAAPTCSVALDRLDVGSLPRGSGHTPEQLGRAVAAALAAMIRRLP